MPLTVTEVGEITEDIAIWLNDPTIGDDFSVARDVSPSSWDGTKAIDCEGANRVQVMFWAQKAANRAEDVDLAVYGITQGTSAIVAWSVLTVGITRGEGSLYVASGRRPINDGTIDATAAWYAAARVARNQPREAEYPFAIDPFEYRIIQEHGLMPILELKTVGFVGLMMEVRTGRLRPPSKLLVLSKLR